MKKLILLVAVVLAQLFAYAQSSITYHLDIKQSKLLWKDTKTIGTKHFGYLLFNSGWLRTNAAGKLSDGMFNCKSCIHETSEVSVTDRFSQILKTI